MNWPACGPATTIKYGSRVLKRRSVKRVQRYRCNMCGSVFYEKEKAEGKKE